MAVTVKGIVAVWKFRRRMAETVNVYEPAAAMLDAASCKELDPEPGEAKVL